MTEMLLMMVILMMMVLMMTIADLVMILIFKVFYLNVDTCNEISH